MKKLALLILLLLPIKAYASGGLTLVDTNDTIELETSGSASTDFKCSSLEITASATTPLQQSGNVASATTTTIVSAPSGASTQKKVSGCTIYNRSTTASQTVTIKFDDNATERHLFRTILGPRESLQWNEELGWLPYNENGLPKKLGDITAYSGLPLNFWKIGTAAEAAAQRYMYAKDAGFPGAWGIGAPGLNGANTDCSSNGASGAALMGSPYLPNPTTGANFLTYGAVSSTTTHYVELIDILWYNSGITVTTTTAQNITTPTLPARDNNGLTEGQGVQAALYVTTVTGNAGATAPTLSYTDQDGNAGNTATGSVPITAVAGTLIPFALAAGDNGIRSIQNITLVTSLVSGVVNLITYRPIAAFPQTVANVGAPMMGMFAAPAPPGIRLYNGTCLQVGYVASATTATNLSGVVSVMER